MSAEDIGTRALRKAALLLGDAPTNGHSQEPPPAGDSPATDPHRCNLTDLGNAERLVDAHGANIRYSHELGKYLIYDGHHWKPDDGGAGIAGCAKQTARAMHHEAAAAEDTKQATEISRHALRSQSADRLKAMSELARSEPGVPIELNELDRDPYLFNVTNGTLDLRTGDLRPHRRSDFLSKLAPVAYDPGAHCDGFLAFLDRIMEGNADLIGFLQRALGYSLSGNISERVLFILHGSGRNGKTTLLEAIRDVLGSDYTDRTPTDLLLTRRHEGIPNDIAALRGKRFVSASEVNEGRRLDEAKIKDLTGGDTISARFMRGEFFTFRPECKLWLSTNHRPVIRGTDAAMWDRLRLVPFNVRIPDDEVDRDLGQKLREEASGILAWMVDGCQLWLQGGLKPPAEVQTATDAYRADMDVLGGFLTDCCTLDARAITATKDLYAAYVAWCGASGEQAVSKNLFSRQLTERGFVDKRTSAERRWQGIGLVGTDHATTLEGVE